MIICHITAADGRAWCVELAMATPPYELVADNRIYRTLADWRYRGSGNPIVARYTECDSVNVSHLRKLPESHAIEPAEAAS